MSGATDGARTEKRLAETTPDRETTGEAERDGTRWDGTGQDVTGRDRMGRDGNGTGRYLRGKRGSAGRDGRAGNSHTATAVACV